MQPPGGFGGGQGNGYPPGGFPPGGAPGQYPGMPQQGAPQQPYGGPQQAQYGAPAPQQGGPQPAYGAPPPAQQYPGMPPGQYGAPPGYGAPAMMPGQLPPGMPGTPQMPVGVGIPGGMQMQMPGASPGNSFGQAQSALKGAGGMMAAMKWGFVAIGGLCVLGGLALLVLVDVVTGVSMIFTGGVLVVVAFLVLPRFTGMLGQATAMVDGFAAKEQLAQTGIPAMGRLVSVQQTGRLVNYNPEIHAVVEVHHPQLGPYQTQTTAIVPQIAIPRAQPGAQVQVRVSPQNQHEIALVF